MNDETKNKINYRNTFYQQLKKYRINLTDPDVVNNLTSAYLQLFLKERMNTTVMLLKD